MDMHFRIWLTLSLQLGYTYIYPSTHGDYNFELSTRTCRLWPAIVLYRCARRLEQSSWGDKMHRRAFHFQVSPVVFMYSRAYNVSLWYCWRLDRHYVKRFKIRVRFHPLLFCFYSFFIVRALYKCGWLIDWLIDYKVIIVVYPHVCTSVCMCACMCVSSVFRNGKTYIKR